ncbi:hypothetical protein FRX31_018433 [Thalictrum thalictroides]|uniref:Uncharacterized protein n=1 Tax=Thalictrum thalictroides TaxID=46969 RepID=A0A7J6W623_THATH|nr:hypothetical protein FRX31_018433 [Thalictrum thalictroides]
MHLRVRIDKLAKHDLYFPMERSSDVDRLTFITQELSKLNELREPGKSNNPYTTHGYSRSLKWPNV